MIDRARSYSSSSFKYGKLFLSESIKTWQNIFAFLADNPILPESFWYKATLPFKTILPDLS